MSRLSALFVAAAIFMTARPSLAQEIQQRPGLMTTVVSLTSFLVSLAMLVVFPCVVVAFMRQMKRQRRIQERSLEHMESVESLLQRVVAAVEQGGSRSQNDQ